MVVNFGWVFFRAPHTKDAIKFIITMFGMSNPVKVGFSIFWYLDKWTITILIFAILFASSVPSKIAAILKAKLNENIFMVSKYILLLAILYLSMLRIVSGTYNPFIYFQF